MFGQPVNERFAILREIFQLAQEQKTALDADDIELFQQLLMDREMLLSKLVVADQGNLPENVVPFRGATSPSEADYDDETAISVLIRGILDQDAENELVIRAKIGAVQDAMQRVGRGAVAARRYKGYADSSMALDRFAS